MTVINETFHPLLEGVSLRFEQSLDSQGTAKGMEAIANLTSLAQSCIAASAAIQEGSTPSKLAAVEIAHAASILSGMALEVANQLERHSLIERKFSIADIKEGEFLT